ncbi:helix-turn-helix domain-containing protein [Catenulispora pinisilvae]|uniref:helix-turn-helix domain-containing protein n=1 Tax=Catenulispora pinisilvae TaxID=2705253 RepID=UPI0018913EDC
MAKTSGVSTAISDPSPAFGTELRRWRTTRRVSQLELANRAGTTQRHLSFMERGRSHPGRAIVLRLAESLRLTLRERNALLFSAGYAPAYEETSYDAPALAPVREAMERVIEGHLPYPALVLRRPGRVIAANRACSVFLEDCAPHLLTPPIDLLRVMLHPDGIAPRVANLAQWGRHVIDNLRLTAMQSPDRGLDALVAELAGYVPEAPTDQAYLGFAVPMRLTVPEGELRLMTALTSFATAVDVTVAESVLESFLPADAESAEILAARDRRAAERGETRLLGGL